MTLLKDNAELYTPVVITAASIIGAILIPYACCRSILHWTRPFAIVVGALLGIAFATIASVLLYHDPGSGQPMPTWKLIGLCFWFGITSAFAVIYPVITFAHWFRRRRR